MFEKRFYLKDLEKEISDAEEYASKSYLEFEELICQSKLLQFIQIFGIERFRKYGDRDDLMQGYNYMIQYDYLRELIENIDNSVLMTAIRCNRIDGIEMKDDKLIVTTFFKDKVYKNEFELIKNNDTLTIIDVFHPLKENNNDK